MIGIGTNRLLRLWLGAEPALNKRIDARWAAHSGTLGWTLVKGAVLAEAVWTLKAAVEQDKDALLIAVRSPLEETSFTFDDREAVAAAFSLSEAGSCEFADCVVVAKHARQGCEYFATFDPRHAQAAGLQGTLT